MQGQKQYEDVFQKMITDPKQAERDKLVDLPPKYKAEFVWTESKAEDATDAKEFQIHDMHIRIWIQVSTDGNIYIPNESTLMELDRDDYKVCKKGWLHEYVFTVTAEKGMRSSYKPIYISTSSKMKHSTMLSKLRY